MSETELSGALWEKIGEGEYKNKPLPPEVLARPLPLNDTSILKFERIRNARLEFEVEIFGEPKRVHAAVLFRKNGDKYLGAGLGGWGSHYSLFVRNRSGIVGYPIGFEAGIAKHRIYKFKLEFQAGFISEFSVDGESLIFSDFSIHETLRSSLSLGHIGLYTYAETQARFKIKVAPKANRCFVITNLNPEMKPRRDRLANILRALDVQCDLVDATDLSRERPLMRKIKEGIISADFVIADFGFQQPRDNVLYETGIAHSLGVPTIHLGPQQVAFDKHVPSDLRAQFFILDEELDQKLPLTIREVLESSSGSFDYLGGE